MNALKTQYNEVENSFVKKRKEARDQLKNFNDTVLEPKSTELRTRMQRVEAGIREGHQVKRKLLHLCVLLVDTGVCKGFISSLPCVRNVKMFYLLMY